MRVLIAEDDLHAAAMLRQTLERGGFAVDHAGNGREALELLMQREYLFLLTDWMMPEMDGLELIARARVEVPSPPLIVFITSVDSEESRGKALESGADEFLSRPLRPDAVLGTLNGLIQRRQQELFAMVGGAASGAATDEAETSRVEPAGGDGPKVIGVATSSGGPTALREVLRGLPADLPATVLVVLHGQPWVIESVIPRLRSEVALPIEVATDGTALEPGRILFAPGDVHLSIDDRRLLRVADGNPVNFVKPSADVLFGSMAEICGASSIGAVLTGRGQDGAAGTRAIVAAGGRALVQDPDGALAAGMPQTTLSGCPQADAVELERMAERIAEFAGAATKLRAED